MQDIHWLWWLLPTALLPIFFAMGWVAARIDLRALLQQAKTIPDGIYRALDALIDRQHGAATMALDDVMQARAQQSAVEMYPLSISLGRLYRLRGEYDKAIHLHQKLLLSPDITTERKDRVLLELGLDYQKAGLVARAEEQLLHITEGVRANDARQVLLTIYEQDRNWDKAIHEATQLAHDAVSYHFEIAQYYCELAQNALWRGQDQQAKYCVDAALRANSKCARASLILGDIEKRAQNHEAAIAALSHIEKQNHAYLSMAAEPLYDAYASLNRAAEGLDFLIGLKRTYPELDILKIIYEKALALYGEEHAVELSADLIRNAPNLAGLHLLLGFRMNQLPPLWRSDADMMRTVIAQALQKSLMYRCRHCHFRSQVFFWHCPACNQWETFTPNRIEV